MGFDYYPKLVIAVPFTPATGDRVLVHPKANRLETIAVFARDPILGTLQFQTAVTGAGLDSVTDVALYAPATGAWVIQRSHDDGLTQLTLGGPGALAAPADFDGDGKLDVAVFETATGNWSYRSSQTSNTATFKFAGGKRYLPVPADYDGDGLADAAVSYSLLGIGGAGQVATPGDFDGDGKVDPAAYRRANGLWRYLASGNGTKTSLPLLGGSAQSPVVGQRPQ